ncbi:MAG: nucleotide pyrophosphohydrolase, partial [Phycisphaerales bacterium]|nr:nucleotide pyrophosphohydrolase [Phycisphaerales bacterium]
KYNAVNSPKCCIKNLFVPIYYIMSKKDLTIRRAQEIVDAWIKKYGVRYFNELTNLGMLIEEVGELSRIIVRKYGEQSSKKSDKSYDLGEEMSDILFVLICLANQTGVDLTKSFENNLSKKTKRDKQRHKQNSKLLKNNH